MCDSLKTIGENHGKTSKNEIFCVEAKWSRYKSSVYWKTAKTSSSKSRDTWCDKHSS